MSADGNASDTGHYARGRVGFISVRSDIMDLIEQGYAASVVYRRFKDRLGGIKLRQFQNYVAKERARKADAELAVPVAPQT